MASLNQMLNHFFTNDIGIDLGTANSLVLLRGRGIVLKEPSVVSIDTETDAVLAVGQKAKDMIGRTPGSIRAIRPMKEGVIANYDITEAMLRHFLHQVRRTPQFFKPRVLVAVPSGITVVEERAVRDSALHAGARDVDLIKQPMAAARGVGLPVDEPTGNMIVDIGGGTTQVALISLGDIVNFRTARFGGDSMDDAIIRMVKKAYNLLIGERTAEDIKLSIGSAYAQTPELQCEVRGRDLNTGRPKTITLSSPEVREALMEPVNHIVEAVNTTLDQSPPELAGDLIIHGVMMSGGGSQLRGLDKLLSEETGLQVTVADDPMTAVARGTGAALDGGFCFRGKSF